MKLLGGFLSPYVRRTAVSLNLTGLNWESVQVSVWDDPNAVKQHNPLVRVPTLVLDDGEALVESYAILDAIDELAGAKRLTPASGAERRRVMKATAVAAGAIDKTIWAVYELRFHDKEHVSRKWVEHNEAQALGGFEWLDNAAKAAGDGWLCGPAITEADVTAAVGFSFASKVRPKLGLAEKFPALAAHNARCEALDAFKNAPLPS
ncbi:MAG: glutathione S-transferase family protein [Alphaproteobacteria bacterium]|nr:glutathione S-transferase family protein [Alphaproteobacteria bacterium]MCB9930916.1 glutathione S-transferase family protein [Alphaproteobacteria bacterium]